MLCARLCASKATGRRGLSTMARRPRKSATPAPVLQLRIELDDIEPLVWRRVPVAANITLWRLHRVIQAAMGWTHSHLQGARQEGGG